MSRQDRPTARPDEETGQVTSSRVRLERRYRTLLRAYPAGYRAERGDELVGTYLELAGPSQRWPRAGDGFDALRGGIRARVRASAATGVVTGVPTAARCALAAAVALAAVWLVAVESKPLPEGYVIRPFGLFQTLGAAVWTGWLAAGVAAIVLPARVTRGFVVAAMAVTAAVVPAAALLPYARPPLHVLVPQLALGLIALRWTGRPHWTTSLLATAVAVSLAATAALGLSAFGYWANADVVLAYAAVALLGAGVLGGFVGALRGERRGWWAALALLVPATMLFPPRLVPRPMFLVRSGALPSDDRLMLATVSAVTVALVVGAVLLALAAHRRLGRHRRT